MKTYCVYRHIFPNGKSYIGITNDVCRRWRNGKGYVGQGKIGNAIDKYGWHTIKHEILADSVTIEEARELEKYYIHIFDTISNGYNISIGGDAFFSGQHHTDDARKRISAKMKQYTKTVDHRRHISDKKAGTLHHFAKKVYQFSMDGTFIREWSYMNEASVALQISKGNISQCCLGMRPSAGGYKWSYSRGVG